MFQMKYSKDVTFRKNFSHGGKEHGEEKRSGRVEKKVCICLLGVCQKKAHLALPLSIFHLLTSPHV